VDADQDCYTATLAVDGKRLAEEQSPGDSRVHLTSLVSHSREVALAHCPTTGKGA